VLSYQKMLGQLHDAGNTTTLAHYLDLLSGAGLIVGLPKFYGKRIRQRLSSPKIQVLNTALMSAPSNLTIDIAQHDHKYWGRLVESTVGAHLVNCSRGKNIEIFYWLERNQEVDFVLRFRSDLIAIEVRTGRRRERFSGVEVFSKTFKVKRQLLVGSGGIPVEEFLTAPIEQWLR
jgi:predicted AAA+ superfamily ATPase